MRTSAFLALATFAATAMAMSHPQGVQAAGRHQMMRRGAPYTKNAYDGPDAGNKPATQNAYSGPDSTSDSTNGDSTNPPYYPTSANPTSDNDSTTNPTSEEPTVEPTSNTDNVNSPYVPSGGDAAGDDNCPKFPVTPKGRSDNSPPCISTGCEKDDACSALKGAKFHGFDLGDVGCGKGQYKHKEQNVIWPGQDGQCPEGHANTCDIYGAAGITGLEQYGCSATSKGAHPETPYSSSDLPKGSGEGDDSYSGSGGDGDNYLGDQTDQSSQGGQGGEGGDSFLEDGSSASDDASGDGSGGNWSNNEDQNKSDQYDQSNQGGPQDDYSPDGPDASDASGSRTNGYSHSSKSSSKSWSSKSSNSQSSSGSGSGSGSGETDCDDDKADDNDAYGQPSSYKARTDEDVSGGNPDNLYSAGSNPQQTVGDSKGPFDTSSVAGAKGDGAGNGDAPSDNASLKQGDAISTQPENQKKKRAIPFGWK